MDFTLDGFSGPLDLLLFLIKKNQVDIRNIPIALIADQYIAYMDELHLSAATQFAVLASELLYLKSRAMLPRTQEYADDEASLIERIQTYERIKQAAKDLFERQDLNRPRAYFRQRADIVPLLIDNSMQGVDVAMLGRCYQYALDAYRAAPDVDSFAVYAGKRLSLWNSALRVLRVIRRAPQPIALLFTQVDGRAGVVSIFLALLELVRRGTVILSTEDGAMCISRTHTRERSHADAG